jgi:hypothetical protein
MVPSSLKRCGGPHGRGRDHHLDDAGDVHRCAAAIRGRALELSVKTNPDHSNLFADCDVIVCYGNAKPEDRYLASTIHCIDDEIIERLERREQRRRDHHGRIGRRPTRLLDGLSKSEDRL